ncbi:MAG TPA: type II secretion system F family protein [Solirubrobacter sp.]|nr:type II secretion system F family protein [Solirubrobacter sp.]
MTTFLALAASLAAAAGIVDLCPGRRRRGVLTAIVAKIGAGLGMRASAGLARRVAAAGLDRPVGEVVALQAGLALTAGVAALPLAAAAPGRLGVVILLAAPTAGYLAPEAALHRRINQRKRAIEIELPDVLDLLRVAIAAGLAPRRALAEVGRRHPGVLAAELNRSAARASLGETAESTLDELAQRCPAAGIPQLTAALKRAERHGAPLGTTLRAEAAEARSLRAAQRSELAARAAPKIQLVVALLLVPAVLLLVAAALIPALLGG